ncbi:OLC1v1022247C1 [Oldenlandia corymbosa var. corymbosa]|uniref:OLC1v1022247C1 n=1 Tax=Oldenlandia corymbosa var. corymbosa TaxID=529605 RepID=A0AAV1BZP6_OLDCO|nr:OLC1v1022247C1 [Oldenlandia corymbosa var. corymbosa]
MADESSSLIVNNSSSAIMESKQHPLHQIAETPSHKLLLKQWLKEEELILNRIAFKETQIDSIRKEITQLYCFFFLFHSTALLLLFSTSSSSSSVAAAAGEGKFCRRSWIPSLCSLLFSLGMIWAVRYKMDVEAHTEKLLEREKEDWKLLGKCSGELKKKGLEFDLLKEVDALRRAKSLRVESSSGKAGVRKWSALDFATLFFFTVSCSVLALTRVILCY